MIGIKALWQGTQHPKTSVIVGIIALIASASGTALSSMNSFYGSQEEVIRNQRTIAQLTQLHWRVVQDALTDPKICVDDVGPQSEFTSESESMKKVMSWKQRHEEILNDAMPSFSRPGDVLRNPPVQLSETEKTSSSKRPR